MMASLRFEITGPAWSTISMGLCASIDPTLARITGNAQQRSMSFKHLRSQPRVRPDRKVLEEQPVQHLDHHSVSNATRDMCCAAKLALFHLELSLRFRETS